MKKLMGCFLITAVTVCLAFAGCTGSEKASSKQVTSKSTPTDGDVANYTQSLDQPVSVQAAQSPGGERLTVQFAAKAICEAAHVPYQFEKSQSMAGDDCRRFIPPLSVNGVPAKQALTDLLTPLGMRFGVDDKGIFLQK